MNTHDLLQGFQKCKEEIVTLRRANELLTAQLSMADRILTAVNSHRPAQPSGGMSEDIIWQIGQTEKFLQSEIDKKTKAAQQVLADKP